MLSAALLCLVVFSVTAGFSYLFTQPGSRLHILDHPNHRSLHDNPVPRSGGVAVLAGILLGTLGLILFEPFPFQLIWLAVGLIVVSGIGFLDDLGGVNPLYRLVAQTVAAVCLLFAGFQIDQLSFPGVFVDLPYWVAVLFTILLVVWMVNLYNFMDGMDGLAGSMAVIGFGTLAIIGMIEGNPLFAMLNGIVASAAGGFLALNLPPARIFLGDAGAYGFGFLGASMLLWGDHLGIVPLWLGIMVFSPFIADATVTLLIRLGRGEPIWAAHREHAYQHAVQLGLGHRKTLVISTVLMVAVSLSSVLLIGWETPLRVSVLIIWLFIYVLLFWYVRKLRCNQEHMPDNLG